MIRKIEALLQAEVVPSLEAHGGSIEVIDVDNNKVYVKMTGGCHGCAGARATLKEGVERIIKERFPMIEEVVDTTDHQSGENPYMS
jgi:Fe-S cluster biogenesis protein NfuA